MWRGWIHAVNEHGRQILDGLVLHGGQREEVRGGVVIHDTMIYNHCINVLWDNWGAVVFRMQKLSTDVVCGTTSEYLLGLAQADTDMTALLRQLNGDSHCI